MCMSSITLASQLCLWETDKQITQPCFPAKIKAIVIFQILIKLISLFNGMQYGREKLLCLILLSLMSGQIVSDWEQNNIKPQSIPSGKKKLVSPEKEESRNKFSTEFAHHSNTQPDTLEWGLKTILSLGCTSKTEGARGDWFSLAVAVAFLAWGLRIAQPWSTLILLPGPAEN